MRASIACCAVHFIVCIRVLIEWIRSSRCASTRSCVRALRTACFRQFHRIKKQYNAVKIRFFEGGEIGEITFFALGLTLEKIKTISKLHCAIGITMFINRSE